MGKRTFDPDKHCGANTRQGRPCARGLGEGTPHPGIGRCALHGGSTPNHVRAAELEIERRQRAALERDARALGVPRHVPPAEGLLDELAKTLGELEWLRALIVAESERDPEALFRGTRLVKRVDDGAGGVVTTTEAGPGLSVKVQTYERWKRHYAQLVAVALSHGIAERQVELAEQQAETLGALVAAALDSAGVQGPARVQAILAARDRFTLIHGGAA